MAGIETGEFPSKVLVVDDEPVILQLLTTALSAEKLPLRTVLTAEEAERALATEGRVVLAGGLRPENVRGAVEADPGLMRQRRCTAEHPFGTIKRMTAGGRFLTRGLNKVKAETALSVLAYNILRTINLVGASGLRASLA